MNPRIASALKWYWQTSALVGLPITLLLLAVGLQKLVFTATCQLAGVRCEYSIGSRTAGDYIAGMLESEEAEEVVLKPKKR